MSRRLISAILLGLTLTVVHASAALANGGHTPGAGIFSANMVVGYTTSFLTGLICYALMVWDPNGARK